MDSNPEIPQQFSDVFGMGAPAQVYKAKASLVLRVIGALLIFAGAAAALLYAAYILWTKWDTYYHLVIYREIAPWVIGSLIAFFVGLWVLWNLYTNRKKAFVVYQNGLGYADRKGVLTWRWDDIHDLSAAVTRNYTNGIYTGTTHVYTLSNNKEKKTLMLNDAIKDVESLYDHIQKNTFDFRYSRVAEGYNSGQPVGFGKFVAISKPHGIKISKKVYPWEEIEQVAINKGVISVKKKGGGWLSGANASAASIPNVDVLLSMINQIVGLKTG